MTEDAGPVDTEASSKKVSSEKQTELVARLSSENLHNSKEDSHVQAHNREDWRDTKIYYQDAALIRFKNEDSGILVLNETSFYNLLNKHRPNDPYWKQVDSIQTCVKSKVGNGEAITIKFRAPIDEGKPAEDCKYTYGDLPPQDVLL